MKKIYLQPATCIYRIENQPIMNFGSPTDENTLNGGGKMGDYESGMTIESRRNSSIWDDE